MVAALIVQNGAQRARQGGLVQRSPWQKPRHSSDSTQIAPAAFRLTQVLEVASQKSASSHCRDAVQ